MKTGTDQYLPSEENIERNLLNGFDNTFLNPYSYLILRDQRLSYFSSENFHFFYDGFALILLLRLMGRRAKRFSFDDTSLSPVVLSRCSAENLSIGVVGSAPGVALEAVRLLKNRHPALKITVISDGFYAESVEHELLSRALRFDVILCSMGTPRQEDFLYRLREKGWRGTGFTCGGYLDQLVFAKGGDYYPPWIDRLNLRWLYRIAREPRRLITRYVFTYPVGMAAFCHDILRRRISL